ncbi:cytochrome B [Roseobacter denitrificans]|uniref:Cytochrome b561 domain-containing protein n=1 Tax=Roseobacter denitrificans (strain ATCC 33942 / OCh 114) TaxID=375451 RepID=Q162A4_ROSDO|nr:cytochrome b561 domain-containing protein [Roseobacter denitrificans]ABG33189.1 hypothetical protein RD1_3717 [Roseobacter denitrificans OCh 114]AVL52540.1 cytochrome B [Roseobacter denitrificans]SFG29657.1 cytochrome b561 [Roseobacter denitrificans OCh 114]
MMWDWLLAPIDPTRVHDVGFAVSWHARTMVIAWGVIAPLAVLIARFFKVLPGQDWPRELDVQVWWRCHLFGQLTVAALSVVGFVLLYWVSSDGPLSWHGWLGYGVLAALFVQVTLGFMRGDKGGPTMPGGTMRGDHYDMTPWRLFFEHAHKSVGYAAILLALATIIFGLWHANAPHWMWLTLGLWWSMLLCAFIVLQRKGFAVDTYQAIWGADPAHPGNQRAAPGWGVRRMNIPDEQKEERDVRDDRRDRLQRN